MFNITSPITHSYSRSYTPTGPVIHTIHVELPHDHWQYQRVLTLLEQCLERLTEFEKQQPEHIQVLSIPKWWPDSTNALINAEKHERNRLKQQDAEIISAEAMRQHIRKATGRRQVQVKLFLGAKGKKKRGRPLDEDNSCKSLYDALTHAGLIKDDSQVWCRKLMPELVNEPLPEANGYGGTLIILEDLP